jgi:hypothetical protein
MLMAGQSGGRGALTRAELADLAARFPDGPRGERAEPE